VARLVMRLIEPDRGTVRIGDVDLTSLEGKALRAQDGGRRRGLTRAGHQAQP